MRWGGCVGLLEAKDKQELKFALAALLSVCILLVGTLIGRAEIHVPTHTVTVVNHVSVESVQEQDLTTALNNCESNWNADQDNNQQYPGEYQQCVKQVEAAFHGH